MQLHNEPNVKQEQKLLKIIIVSSIFAAILGITFFIISNLGPSQKTLAVSVTRYAVANGSWNSTSTWSASSGGSAGASVPVAGDIVYIGEGSVARAITIPTGYTANCATLYLGSNSYNVANSLTLSGATSILNVTGNVDINRPSGSNVNAINVNTGTATIGGICSFKGTATNSGRYAKLVITSGSLSITGDLVINEGATANNLIDMTGAGKLYLGGNFDPVKTDFTKGTGTIIYNGSLAQTIRFFPTDAYYNLQILNTHSSGASLSAAITTSNLSNNLAVGNSTTACLLSTANYNVAFNNSKTLQIEEAGKINAGTSVISFGTGCSVVINGTFNTTNTTGFSGQTTTSIKNTNSPTITFGANSNIEYAAGSTQTLTAMAYNNLAISGGLKNISSGTLAIDNNLTIASGATYSGSTNNPTVSIGGDFTNNGTFISGNGQFKFSGAGQQTIGGTSSISFADLDIENTFSTAPQVVLGQSITITNNLSLIDGIVSLNNYNIIMASGSSLTDGNRNSFALTTGTGVFKWMSCASNTTRLFPVGHSPSTAGYAPVTLEFNTAHTTDDFSVGTDSIITSNGASNGTPVSTKVVNCTWQIAEGTSGGSNLNLLFTWASNRVKQINMNKALQLLHYTSSKWDKPEGKKYKVENLANNMQFARFDAYTGTFSPFGIGEGDGSVGLIFDGTPTVTGTAGAVGTKYTWNNVGTMDSSSIVIKAVIEIISKTGGASLESIDQSASGSVNAWQPVINGSQSNGNCWGMEFRIRFYVSNTNTRLKLTGCKAQGIDIDGDGQYVREYNRFDKPNSYSLEANTVLTMTTSSGNYTLKGPTSNVPGIDVTETNYAVSCNYQNTDSINVVLGSCCDGGNCSASSGNRLHSINFFDVVPYVAPLPVKMVYFKARVSDKTSLLTWATAAEINNSHFEIERSTDTKEWTNIGRVEGNGNSSRLIKYEFIDNQPMVVNYYRLKQIDFDGKYEFSDVKYIDFKNTVLDGLSCVVFPNPTNGLFTVEINKKSKIHSIKIDILDLQGAVLKQINLEAGGSQYFTTPIDISSFENGIYIVKVTSGEDVQTIKVKKF